MKNERSRRNAAPSYRVYVIDLDAQVLSSAKFRKANARHVEGKPCVYVGSTGLAPEERFERHRSGRWANEFAKAHGLRLRPSPYAGTGPFATRAEAEAAEAALAERLRSRGYAVWSN